MNATSVKTGQKLEKLVKKRSIYDTKHCSISSLEAGKASLYTVGILFKNNGLGVVSISLVVGRGRGWTGGDICTHVSDH